MSKVCSHCGFTNPDDGVACLACGEPLRSANVDGQTANPDKAVAPTARTRWIFLAMILALAAGAIGYRILVHHRLEQSAALFIGLPTLMAMLLVLCPHPKTITGMILKVMCLGLLLSGPVLQEGFICIVFASPLFLLVGLVVGLILDRKKRQAARKARETGLIVALPLLLMSLEGTRPEWSFPRMETVSVVQNVAATPDEVARKLGETPRFLQVPTAIKLAGFPLPVEAKGSGLSVGDERQIHFAGGEGKPGDLLMQITKSEPGFVRFTAWKDTSHYAHWMLWKDSEVRWSANTDGTTKVEWRVHFERKLDPAWYFRPSQRAMVKFAAGHLIETCATP